MQFKHPEILYALLLLIIPVIVHLFQLQRFIKVPFTNVKLLQHIEQQTRKSANLKKWLILATRLLAFFCLILAFAQPSFTNFSVKQNLNLTIYLDNSFSMQAKGENGELLKSISQKIIENNTNENGTISIFTNDNYFKNLDQTSLKKELISIKYSSYKMDFSTVLLKINNHNSTKINTLNKNILITDFQSINFKNKIDFTNVNSSIKLLDLSPIKNDNIFIDSVSIKDRTSTETTIKVRIRSSNNSTTSIPISLYSNSKLIGKATSKFTNSNQSTVQFTIPTSANFNGKISLIDAALEFDNDFYFSINEPKKINVLCIGNTADFLSKIYTENEFNFTTTPLQGLNYNGIQNQNLILLNEIDNIPVELINSLIDYSKNGGNLVVIPSQNIQLTSYNKLLYSLNLGKIVSKIENQHKITSINFNHPLLNDVFEKKINNFQYPKSFVHYQTNLLNHSSIVSFDNNQPFISSNKLQNSTFYWVSSPLNKENSDFTQSPLVVPVFYNFAKRSLKIHDLYYTIAPEIKIELKTSLGKDDVLIVSNETNSSIPLQIISQNKVVLEFQDQITQSGFYNIKNKNSTIKTIAFNYNRSESDLTYLNLESLISNKKNISFATSINEVFKEISDDLKINWLFKWFLAFSVLFLLLEMLILKYFNI